MVHGCFWHGHQCHLFTLPETRAAFWSNKIAANVARDRRTQAALRRLGWRVLTIWECALRGTQRLDIESVLETTKDFLVGKESLKHVEGSHSANRLSPSKIVRRRGVNLIDRPTFTGR
jgi:DNA mismatch endonuclease (patch repair protein)